jgi:biotin operon repressor
MGSDGPGRKPTVSDEEILAGFENAEDPVLITDEVAESLLIGRRAVYNRLRSLEEQGISSRKRRVQGAQSGGILATLRLTRSRNSGPIHSKITEVKIEHCVLVRLYRPQ